MNNQLISHWLLAMSNGQNSVLTRILPWGVSGPPLLRNRGPVRTSGGQCYSKLSVTWSTYLIQYDGQGLYNSITHTPIFTAYVGTTKLTAIKFKTRSFNNMFFTHLNKQNAGVLGWTLKLLQSPTLVPDAIYKERSDGVRARSEARERKNFLW